MKINTKISKVFLAMLVFGVLMIGQVFAAATDDFEIGTQNLNNTVQNSAKIGDQLFKPEKGWTRYDDFNKNIEYYDGEWATYKDRGELYNGTLHCTIANPSGKMRFNFTGTKIRIITYASGDRSDDTKIIIDGVEYIYSSLMLKPKTMYLSFEKINLKNEEHSVEIHSGTKRYGIILDAIDIDSNGELKTYGPVQEDIKASSLELNKTTSNLEVGNTEALTATVKPDNTTKKSVKWTTSDASIATVDQNGKVTAVKAGTANITATTQDGSNLSASCNVTVTEPAGSEDILATSITLNKTSLEVDVDKTAIIEAIVKPDDAADKTVKWVSSDPSIAIVYSNGKVKGVKPGKVTITATTQDGSNLSATCEVTVRDPQGGGEVEATKATLGVTMVSGKVHNYDLSMTEVNKFIAWIDGRANGQGNTYYMFEKKSDTGNIIMEYLMYDKIESFTVNPVK